MPPDCYATLNIPLVLCSDKINFNIKLLSRSVLSVVKYLYLCEMTDPYLIFPRSKQYTTLQICQTYLNRYPDYQTFTRSTRDDSRQCKLSQANHTGSSTNL
ncbi:hypothetical protein RF11_00440 [Thelohanellus kitauei]|uniref:Uncharacterized protein n=1 Tax=Thelohanellus kitauei TaxID=669202 RepID=A0A0C2N1Q3_THEKT|nr:hypothetical protein RF11_00440 [Thelohanellus kitauei]